VAEQSIVVDAKARKEQSDDAAVVPFVWHVLK
jgi:hypothetical protein